MGGCEEGPDACTNKTCKGHEVDIMHFSIGNAIPGRLYGGNPIDNRDGNGGDRWYNVNFLIIKIMEWHVLLADTCICFFFPFKKVVLNVLCVILFVNRFGHLVDLYAWNAHCRYLDGIGPSGIPRVKVVLLFPVKGGNETCLYDEKMMGLPLKEEK